MPVVRTPGVKNKKWMGRLVMFRLPSIVPDQPASDAGDHTRCGDSAVAGLGRLGVGSGCRPARRRARNVRRVDGDVLRWGEALQRRRAGGSAAEIGTLVVSRILLFVGGEVAEV